mmetsp:Transcript_12499/g.32009  ORF Transcript_12499/g.32009 Transcript_12499/m.32009 type:complete len:255 (+) Transcript_12499:189-953(+)
MDGFLKELWASAQDVVRRLSALVGDNPPQTLRLTGVLGLAVLLVGIYHMRPGGNPGSGGNNGRRLQAGETAADAQKRDEQELPPEAASSPLAAAIFRRFRSIRRITLSCPGVILQQRSAAELQEGAELCEGIAAIIQELATVAEVYLLAHVEDDIGEATVSGALEAAGITGRQAGQVRLHRVLFCGTLEGKVSLVRQLEPDMHVDGESRTVHDLQRFVPQLLHVAPEGQAGPAAAGPNVDACASLPAYLGLATA